MIKRTAYQCEYCKKLLINHTQMKQHESKCFYNPESKSCITCKFLCVETIKDGNFLTERESNILQYKVEGTYKLTTVYDEADHYVLLPEYEYLYDLECENVCDSQRIILKKLKTDCIHHNIRNKNKK